MKHLLDMPLRVYMARYEYEKFEIQLKSNGDGFSQYRIDHICSTFMREYGRDIYSILPDDWKWCNYHNGEKLYARLRRALYSGLGSETVLYGTKNTIDQAIASSKISHNPHIDWTFTIDWNDGDFGDKWSCYFPPGNYVNSMHDNGVGAVRAYINNSGKSRAWMAIDQPFKRTITIYNAYGNYECLDFGEFLCHVLEKMNLGKFEYFETDIDCKGSAHINGDAVVICPIDRDFDVPELVTVDLEKVCL